MFEKNFFCTMVITLEYSAKKLFYTQSGRAVFAAVFLPLVFIGCSPSLSSPEQVTRFKNAGPIRTVKNLGQPVRNAPGPYRVIPGDVLEFQMGVDLRVVSSELVDWHRPAYGRQGNEPYVVRVSDAGTITLPIVGEQQVAGRTLAEIEALVKSAYYPRYVVNSPMLFCRVEQYQGEHERVFTVMGLVNKPDAYDYPPDVQYNLMEALAFAGGLDMVADPRYVKVFRQNAKGQILQATFGLSGNRLTDAYKIAIKPGDVVYVDHTPRTRVNKFLSDVFHITVGATARSDFE